MVGLRNHGGQLEYRAPGAGKQLCPKFGVRAHDDHFFRCMRAGLVEDGVRNADLADVVQGCGQLEHFTGGFIKAMQLAEHLRQYADAPHMIGGFPRA